MRTQSLVALALFVACCGETPANPYWLPSCPLGEAVTFAGDGKTLCAALGSDGSRAPLPSCSLNEALIVDSGAGAGGVHCGPRSNVLDLVKLGSQLNELDNLSAQIINLLKQLGPAVTIFGAFVGLTTTRTAGRTVDRNGVAGVSGAASLCAEQYGSGCHVCTPYELHRSASLGLFDNQSVARSWVYFPAWNAVPTLTNSDRERGLGDTCAGFLADGSSAGYRGVTMQWGLLSTGSPGFTFLNGNASICTSYLPLACCR